MNKLRLFLIPILLFMLSACQEGFVSGGKLKLRIPETKPTISQVKIVNNQLIVIGSNLSNVTVAKVEGSTNHSFTIETKTSEKLILNARSALSFLVGQSINLIVSSAEASTTFPISFELQNGQVTAAKLHSMGATSGQVLRFNGTSWTPASLSSSQFYAGTYNASTDTPDIVTLGGPTGTYYIVTTSGSQNFGSGLVNFDVGDWVIYNGSAWERVPVGSNTVSSFNGRTGIVVPLIGDYSWSMLTKAAGKLTGSKLEEIADVDITGIQDGDIIRWNNSTLKWEVDALPTMTIVAGSISSTELASSSVNSAKITDGSIVDADIAAGAAISQSKILNLATSLAGKEPVITAGTTLQYLRGDKSLATLNTTAVPEGTNEYFTQARVRQTPLTGYTVGTAIPLAITDTVLEGLGKLEAQNAAISTAQGNYVLLDGTDAMTGDLQMGNNKITGLATPTANTDAATKAYVDSITGTSQWTTTGSDIYYSTGSVGIGTNSPTTNLHILSNQPSSEVHPNRAGLILESEGTSVGGRLALKVYSDTESPLFVGYRARGTKASPTALLLGDQISGFAPVGYDGAGGWQTGAHIRFNTTENWGATNIGSSISFRTPENGSTNTFERMKIDHNGNVGIGTSAPQAKLDVKGSLLLSGSTSGYVGFAPAAAAGSTIYTLPVADGSDGDLLKTNGAGVLAWVPPQSGAPSGTAGGDLDGTYPNPTVKTGLSVTKLAGGTIDNTEFGYLNGVTSNIQTQLDAKEGAITAGTTLEYLRGDKSLATLNTTVVPEGTNEYFTQGRVRTTPISGYAVGTAIPLAATDTFMEAFGKLEAQIIANDTDFDNSGQWSKNGTIVYHSGGRVGIGTDDPSMPLHITSTGWGTVLAQKSSNDNSGAEIHFYKSRGTPAAMLPVQVNDRLMGLYGAGTYSSTQLTDNVASIQMMAAENFTSTAQGTLIDFGTTAIGTTNRVTRMTISPEGNVGVGANVPFVKFDVRGTVMIGDGGETCSSTIAGALRFNSATSLTESCNGTDWNPLGDLASIPASSSILMDACPVGWTDTGAASGASCNGTTCRMCQSPAVESVIPANVSILMETCPANWTPLSIELGPSAAGYVGIGFTSCQSPATSSGIPKNSKIIMPSCPAQWSDLGGTASGGPFLASCSGAPCRICEVPGIQLPSSIIASSVGSTSAGRSVTLRGGNGGSVSGRGGGVDLRGGTPVDGHGGDISLTATAAMTTTASNWSGGSVSISAGNGVTDGNGGNITINAGTAPGLGTHGNILLNSSGGSGFVGIGIATPTYKLDVGGDVNINASYSLLFSGVSVCTSVGCTSSSDKRLKENINPLENALEKILQIQGVEYHYIDKDKYTDKKQVGVIAQEVEKVYPEAVRTDPKSGFKSVAYDHLIAPVIEAIRELNQKIIELFSDTERHSREIASIKEENAKLKQENADIKAYLCRKDPGAHICNN